MKEDLEYIFTMQANQLVDSQLASTRHYWRREILKLSEEIVNDPRPLKEVLNERLALSGQDNLSV